MLPILYFSYANFLWRPQENDCAKIDFDSILTMATECSLAETKPFHGIIGNIQSCNFSKVADDGINYAPLIFSIHPNPATNSIQVQIANNTGKLHYELFDALGISRKNGMTSDNSFQMDVSELAAKLSADKWRGRHAGYEEGGSCEIIIEGA